MLMLQLPRLLLVVLLLIVFPVVPDPQNDSMFVPSLSGWGPDLPPGGLLLVTEAWAHRLRRPE